MIYQLLGRIHFILSFRLKISAPKERRDDQNILAHCEWGEWRIGRCDRSCGVGKRTKTRTIKFEAKNGGRECDVEGSSSTTEDCNVQDCPGKSL